jgi:hypothetical protein
MRQMLLLTMLLVAAVPHRVLAEDALTQLRQMTWLAGTWQRTDLPTGQSGYERWTDHGAQGFVGIGVSERSGKTVFEEELRIVAKDGTLYYVADVAENPQPVYFKLTEFDKNGFTFENPAHDFPQKIVYRRDAERLQVEVSAGDKTREFEFERQR